MELILCLLNDWEYKKNLKEMANFIDQIIHAHLLFNDNIIVMNESEPISSHF